LASLYAQLLAKARRGLDYLEQPRMLVGRQAGVHVGFIGELLEIRSMFDLRPQTFIDVGANVGDFSAAARFLYPEAQIHAFEPNPAHIAALQGRFHGDARATIHACALASRDELRDLHVTGADTLASLLSPAADLAAHFGPAAARASTLRVPTRRLDATLSIDQLPSPRLLKIDVQGAELEVLRGAGAMLSGFDAVKLEISFETYYAGQAQFSEVISLMTEHGFRSFYQQGCMHAEGRPRWCDLVFLR
jgi:FkbM family methyltransferase